MPKLTFRKHERLSHDKDIKRVFNKGRVFKHPALIMFTASRTLYTPSGFKTTDTSSRFGIVVTKKLGKATRRNRIKRLLREIIRLNKMYLSASIDIVFLPRAEAALLNFQSLNKIVLTLWKRAGILKQHITAGTGSHHRKRASGTCYGLVDSEATHNRGASPQTAKHSEQ